MDGRGVSQNDTEALRWYRLAADQGHVGAQYNLGFMYDYGHGVPQSDVEATRWYRLACDEGHAGAQYNLWFMNQNSAGVPQNDVMAYMWTNISASRLDGELREKAGDFRDAIAARLTPDQLAEGQRLALEWDATRPRD